MKKKTLLSKKNIATFLVTVSAVGSGLLLTGCTAIQKMNEVERIEEEIEKEETSKETKKEALNNKVEEIYLEYLDGNKILKQEFDELLEKNFGDKEYILEYLKRQKIYNDNQYKNYLEEKEKLEERLDKDQITKNEFEIKNDHLLKQYLEGKNKIQDYLTEEEIEILENCEEDIENLYKNHVKTTKGAVKKVH